MTIASGIAKQVAFKKESSWGVAPGVSGGQYLRRVSSSLDVVKNTYESNEIRTDYQVADFRHGTRHVEGNLQGELSLAAYAPFLAAILRKDFAAGASASSLSVTPDNGAKTFVRSTGSWLTDGFKVGDVVRFSGFTSGAAANNGINFRITALVALTMTVAEAPTTSTQQSSITCAVTGKKTLVPDTGHTNDSFAIEHFYSDVSQSELFTGLRVNSCEIALPATGLATINLGFLGKDVTTGVAAYYTAVTAASANAILAAVSGKLSVSGTDVAVVTGATINIAGGQSVGEVVGSNAAAAIFPGRVRVSGQLTAYFENATLRDTFLNETEASLNLMLTAGSSTSADFMVINMPRIKTGGAQKGDGEQGIIQTIPFTALYNSVGGTGIATDKTTIAIQDSLA